MFYYHRVFSFHSIPRSFLYYETNICFLFQLATELFSFKIKKSPGFFRLNLQGYKLLKNISAIGTIAMICCVVKHSHVLQPHQKYLNR